MPVKVTRSVIARVGSLFFVLYLLAGCVASNWTPPSSAVLPSYIANDQKLVVRYFGVSTLLFDNGSNAIMIDGFLSRNKAGKPFIRKMTSNEQLIIKTLERAEISPGSLDGIFVAHSHYDHALDSSFVADYLDANLYGSMHALALEDYKQEVIIEPGFKYDFNGLNVTAFETSHGAKPWYLRGFELGLLLSTGGWKYCSHGSVYNFVVEYDGIRVLVVPSAGISNLGNHYGQINVVFLGVGLLSRLKEKGENSIEQYWDEHVRATGAKLVIPIHWDNFNISLEVPLEAPPKLIDDIEATIKVLNRLAKRDEVSIKYAPVIDAFGLN